MTFNYGKRLPVMPRRTSLSGTPASALAALLVLVASVGCASDPGTSDPLDGITVIRDDLTDIPLRGSSDAQVEHFLIGDALFDAVFREPDGLGPLYIRTACASCHEAAAKGPGAVQKVALVEADGVTPIEDQSELAYGNTLRPYLAAGATTPIDAPSGAMVKVSQRMGPAVFGRGYMEAVADSEIERIEAEQKARTDGIHGRINRITYTSKPNPDTSFHAFEEGQTGIIGRFGLKARVASLDDFTADAYQGDMGITSPMRPGELPNPDGLLDDDKGGLDIDIETVNLVADYMRLLEIPRRDAPSGRGPELFEQAKCSVCHVPSLKTRADYPYAELAGIDAPVYTDFLLHDMSADLADGLTDGAASPRAWRTAPLIGLRHLRGYMHDGRAKTVEQAILLHEGPGSEADGSAAIFKAMPYEDRSALIAFVASL
jgi:CxxC motif-containing protein (DUF1111 family)